MISTLAADIPDGDSLAPVLDKLRQALRGLRYGTVTLIVQDGIVVQVDRTEKLRLTRPS